MEDEIYMSHLIVFYVVDSIESEVSFRQYKSGIFYRYADITVVLFTANIQYSIICYSFLDVNIDLVAIIQNDATTSSLPSMALQHKFFGNICHLR
jgi:hypothetical protein